MKNYREVRTSMIIEDGVTRLTTYINDFAGDVEHWKLAFYELWRFQMGYDFAHELKLEQDGPAGDVYVSLLVKDAYKRSLLNTMHELGYGKIEECEEHIGLVDTWGPDEDPYDDILYTVVVA